MHVRIFDELKRDADDNSTLSIIFCVDKDETIVKYFVLEEDKQTFIMKVQQVCLAIKS